LYDIDGDGVYADEDCNDLDDSIYPGAEEIPDDGIDQDCNGSDLEINNLDADEDGFSTAEGDCNDNDGTIYPGAEEIPYDGIDQDCDGEDLNDLDGDGFSPEDGDCDDNNADINPDIEEIPYDGIDQDCDGEDLTDVDGDGYSPEDGDCNDEDEDISPDGIEIPNDGIDQDCDGEDLIVDIEENDPAQISILNLQDGFRISGNAEWIDFVNLRNADGKLVYSGDFKTSAWISKADFAAGIYILTLSGPEYIHSFNLMIQ
jgi:hypothetical protein